MIAEDVAKKIRALEIQGATATAVKAVEALKMMEESGATAQEMEKAADTLRGARPTEPALQNAIDHVMKSREYEQVLSHFRSSRETIANHGRDRVPEDGTVYTHCHSSTVVAVLKEAYSEKEFAVANTETRPVYQGRTTARSLDRHGIPVEHYVDSAARTALEKSDIMLIGADAITEEGDVYNKIGSRLIACAASDLDVQIYVCTDSWKLDIDTLDGEAVHVEERPPAEVWQDSPESVTVRNPAFERLPANLIEGTVTELGILEPAAVADQVRDEYPELF
jgi:eIF-2B alpha/beta/delta-like uncharacterized protein